MEVSRVQAWYGKKIIRIQAQDYTGYMNTDDAYIQFVSNNLLHTYNLYCLNKLINFYSDIYIRFNSDKIGIHLLLMASIIGKLSKSVTFGLWLTL